MKKHYKSLIVFLLFSAISFAQIPSYVPSNGLVGWWPFNGNANDESGNGNNGTVNGSTLTADRFGVANKAYDFNNTFIEVPAHPSLDNEQGTIAFWLKSSNTSLMIPIKKNNFQGAENEQFAIALNYTHLLNVKYNSSCLPGNGWFTSGGNNSVLVDGTWHYVVASFAEENKVFIDGQLISSVASPSPFSDNCPGDLQFGREWSSFLCYYIGNLDDIGIWNRALTDCEINDLFTSQLGSSNTYSSESQSAIDSYTWPVNGQTYTQSGIYTDTLVNAAGCDSVITLNLELDFTGIQTHSNKSLQLYPNPVKDVMTLVGLKGEAVSFAVYSIDGKLLKSGQTSGEIQLEDLKKGNYILKIENEALPFVKL